MLSGLNPCSNTLLSNLVHLFTSEGVAWYFNLGPAIDCKVLDLCGL